MSSLLWILGGTVFLGACAYVCYKWLYSKKEDNQQNNNKDPKETQTEVIKEVEEKQIKKQKEDNDVFFEKNTNTKYIFYPPDNDEEQDTTYMQDLKKLERYSKNFIRAHYNNDNDHQLFLSKNLIETFKKDINKLVKSDDLFMFVDSLNNDIYLFCKKDNLNFHNKTKATIVEHGYGSSFSIKQKGITVYTGNKTLGMILNDIKKQEQSENKDPNYNLNKSNNIESQLQ